MVDQAESILSSHGEPFNRRGWDYIVNNHNGFFPVRIKAVKEGTVVPINNALIVVESTDPKFNSAWVASFIETNLMRIWYPITIATLSREIKKIIHNAMVRTGDPSQVEFKLVDFGSRGVSCIEQSMIGGAAHLVNFKVTDNLPGVAMLMDYYGDGETVPAFSIPATEHSVTTSWGAEREIDFYANIIRNVLPKTKICSVVIDTYDTIRAIEMIGTMRDELEKNGTIVFRPDSGDPVEMTEMVVKKLDAIFGSTLNEKGFKVLNPCARIIQGDGIDISMVKAILDNFERLGYSADNITFGSGGGLLQQVNRDTMRFAMKASNVTVNGESRDIRKTVANDPTKASKKGKLRLIRNARTGAFATVNQHDMVSVIETDMLETVYENGVLLRIQTLDEIRELAAL
jgi:nicotinamide phosphoribosyltransferase